MIIMKISLKNFNSIKDMEIKNKYITVFSGLNNTGKSIVLNLISSFAKSYPAFPTDQISKFSPFLTPSSEIKFSDFNNDEFFINKTHIIHLHDVMDLLKMDILKEDGDATSVVIDDIDEAVHHRDDLILDGSTYGFTGIYGTTSDYTPIFMTQNTLPKSELIFAMFKRLIRNGTFNYHKILIIEYPENYLHPRLQVDFIKMLVSISRVYHVHIIISTYSFYILNSIECFTALNEIADQTYYYRFNREKDDNGRYIGEIECDDCTEDIDRIYSDMFDPIQRFHDIKEHLREGELIDEGYKN